MVPEDEDTDMTQIINLPEEVEKIERHFIKAGLQMAKGCVADAAKLIGLKRTTLVMKMKKYGIKARL